MGGDDAPAFRHAKPRLHLPTACKASKHLIATPAAKFLSPDSAGGIARAIRRTRTAGCKSTACRYTRSRCKRDLGSAREAPRWQADAGARDPAGVIPPRPARRARRKLGAAAHVTGSSEVEVGSALARPGAAARNKFNLKPLFSHRKASGRPIASGASSPTGRCEV
jgi:hypothetical protein